MRQRPRARVRKESPFLGLERGFDRPLRFQLRSADPLHFLHIPKTAGTTFYEILARNFPTDQVYPREAREQLIDDLDVAQQNGRWAYRLTRAHHDHSIYRFFSRTPVMVTMLRDPVNRAVSLYRHIKRVPGHPLHGRFVEEGHDLESACTDRRFRRLINNAQVQYLAGVPKPTQLPQEALWELAKIRLDQIAFFGLVEKFAESLHLLSHTFGWEEVVEYPSLNVSLEEETPNLTPRARELMEPLLELDIELYGYAAELFDQRLGQMREERWAQREHRPPLWRSVSSVFRRDYHLRQLTNPSRIQLARLRRRFVPEGSRLEGLYIRFRRLLLGW